MTLPSERMTSTPMADGTVLANAAPKMARVERTKEVFILMVGWLVLVVVVVFMRLMLLFDDDERREWGSEEVSYIFIDGLPSRYCSWCSSGSWLTSMIIALVSFLVKR